MKNLTYYKKQAREKARVNRAHREHAAMCDRLDQIVAPIFEASDTRFMELRVNNFKLLQRCK